jgi:hypothetical protein
MPTKNILLLETELVRCHVYRQLHNSTSKTAKKSPISQNPTINRETLLVLLKIKKFRIKKTQQRNIRNL